MRFWLLSMTNCALSAVLARMFLARLHRKLPAMFSFLCIWLCYCIATQFFSLEPLRFIFLAAIPATISAWKFSTKSSFAFLVLLCFLFCTTRMTIARWEGVEFFSAGCWLASLIGLCFLFAAPNRKDDNEGIIFAGSGSFFLSYGCLSLFLAGHNAPAAIYDAFIFFCCGIWIWTAVNIQPIAEMEFNKGVLVQVHE